MFLGIKDLGFLPNLIKF